MAEGFSVWITGMPRAGKTTLAKAVAERLRAIGRPVEVLDAGELEDILEGPNKDARTAETRRLAWAAKYLVKYGVVTVVGATSPFREPREKAKREIKRFLEVFVDCPFEVCMARDKDGVYAAGMAGQKAVHGVNEPYEPPTSPDVVVRTDQESAAAGAQKVMDALAAADYITMAEADVGRKKFSARGVGPVAEKAGTGGKKAAPGGRSARASPPRAAAKAVRAPAKRPAIKAAARRGKPAPTKSRARRR